MRDARPFERYLPVRDIRWTVIEVVERTIALGEGIGTRALALRGGPIGIALELGEHRLAIQRALELVAQVVEQEGAHGIVRGVIEQVVHEEHLVGRGGHLRHEHLICGIARGLRPVGEEGVHGVARLVHQGEDVLKRTLEVEEDEGPHATTARGVGATGLARRLVDVIPTLVDGLAYLGDIVLPQGRQRIEHEVTRLLKAVAALRRVHDGHIDVPIARG